MALDNVVPIDADTARLLARRRVHFRWFVAFLTAAYLGVLVPTLLFTPLPPAGPFVLLAILVVLAEHRFVLFGDETSMSASIIVVVASVFVFADSSPLAGPLLIGSLGGLYLPHLRRGSRTLLAANASAFGVSAALAAAIATGSNGRGALGLMLEASMIVAVYWYANSVLIGCASASRQGINLGSSVRTQATSEWPLLILATASSTAVSALAPRTGRELLAIGIALVVFEIQLRSERVDTGTLWEAPWRAATIVGFVATVSHAGGLGSSLALLGVFLVVSSARRSTIATSTCAVSVITAFSFGLATNRLGAGAVITFVIATIAALTAITAMHSVRQAWRLGIRLPTIVVAGLLVPTGVETVGATVAAFLATLLSHHLATGIAELVIAIVALGLASLCAMGNSRTVSRHALSGRRSWQGASR